MSITLDGSNLTTTGVINSATAQNSTSGTSIDFTGIPTGVKRVTVMFNGVSTNGTSVYQVQIGSGSVTTTGYKSVASYISASSPLANSYSSGLAFVNSVAAIYNYSGTLTLTLINSNTWSYTSMVSIDALNAIFMSSGVSPSLGGILDRIRITTVNGTDTFDAGSINILYE